MVSKKLRRHGKSKPPKAAVHPPAKRKGKPAKVNNAKAARAVKIVRAAKGSPAPHKPPAATDGAVAVETPVAAEPSAAPARIRPGAIARGPGLQIEIGRQILYVRRAQIERLPWEPGEVLNHVQIALRELGRGKVEMPPPASLCPQREALLAATAALVPNVRACGMKWFGSFPNNLRIQLPQVSALIVLSDPHRGFPIAVMDGMWVTAQRGPAVSAVACRLLARPESATVAIIGGGIQGRGHIPVLVQVLPGLHTIRIFDTRHAAAVKASKGWRGHLGRRVKIEPVSTIAEAVRGADVIVSATTISEHPEPSVSADMIKSGALILPLDLDAVFEPAVFERADRFYVDSMKDLEALHAQGMFRKSMPSNIAGQLGQLVAGKIPGRSADAERIVCLNMGAGCVDVVLARAIYEKACRLGIGQVLEL